MIPFFPFLIALREEGIEVSLGEWLTFLTALVNGSVSPRLSSLYAVGRALLVKSETLYDRYDRAFLRAFSRLASGEDARALLEQWLKSGPPEWQSFVHDLTRDGDGFLEFLDRLRQHLSPPPSPPNTTEPTPAVDQLGISSGALGGFQRAYKLASERRFRAYDQDRILDTAGMRSALARWRCSDQKGTVPVLDLKQTLESAARNGGEIELKFRYSLKRRRILLLTDVGGTMNVHHQLVERFLTSLRREIRRVDHYYFHNTIYEYLYRDAERRFRISTEDLIRRFSATHTLVLVGDATMGLQELLYPHAAIEGDNEIPSTTLLSLMATHFPRAVWLNPEPVARWSSVPSVQIIAQYLPMYPLTIPGILAALNTLLKGNDPKTSFLPKGSF